MNSTVGMGSEASELTASGLDQNEAFIQRVLGSTNDCANLLDLDDRLTFMSEGGQKVSDFNVIRGCHLAGLLEKSGPPRCQSRRAGRQKR